MFKQSSIKITNTRQYFLRRLLAWVGVKSHFMMRVIHVGIKNKKNLPLDDVEAVYSHLDIERESENISFIKAIYGVKNLGVMYDIGCNYMQFANSLSENFKKIKCFDPNTKVLSLGKQYYCQPNIEINNMAVIPSSSQKSDCFFIEVIKNSGLSSVVFSEPQLAAGQKIHQIESLYIDEIVDNNNSINDLLKIDVEGLENMLVDDAVSLLKFKGIVCFESLSHTSRRDFSNTFRELDYSFYVVKYNFSDFSGLMFNSFAGLLKAIVTNRSTMDIYKASAVDDFDFDFIPLVFCVPKTLESKVDERITVMNGKL